MAHTRASPQTAERGKDLTGRVALVTGGTSGIGAAICHSLVAAGAVVGAGFSSNRERADELRQSIATDGGTLTLHQATWATGRTASVSSRR
jgi:NAD(P)-dependent dehydrogenase (short-subunit alcohol dehydrogenase family)